MRRREWWFSWVCPFDDRRDSHAACGADRHEPAPGRGIAGEELRERREDAGAGRGEGMAERHAPALHVQPRAVDGAQGRRKTQHVTAVLECLPRLERSQHLRGERLVNLVVVEVLEL